VRGEAIALGLVVALALCLVQTGGVRATADLTYDDFNDQEYDTNLGGSEGVMSDGGLYDPTISFVTGANAYEGYALSIQYSFVSNSWCGYWSYFRADESGHDVSAYTHLTMWVKGASGGEKFKVELKDTSNAQAAVYLTSLENFQTGAKTSWSKAEFPLSRFSGVNLKSLKQVNIVFDQEPYSGTIYIDQIKFVELPLPPSPVIATPSSDNLGSGDRFYVDVVVQPAGAIGGVQFDMSFDPAFLMVENVEEGNLLGSKRTDTWVGYWTMMRADRGGYDVSGYSALRIKAKGEIGGKSSR